MTIRVSTMFLVASLLLMFAGLTMTTLPTEPLPSLAWRIHFGCAIWAMGCISGIGLWSFLRDMSDEK